MGNIRWNKNQHGKAKYSDPCGGGLEYLHRSPASSDRRQKGNPVPGDISGPPVPGGYKYEDLYLQVGEVSDQTVLHGHGSCATLTSEWLHCKLETRPLVREGPHRDRTKIPDQNSWKGSKIWSNVHKVGSTPRHTDWLTVSRKVTLTLSLRSHSSIWLWVLCDFNQWVIAL
jgi:hypothetical protein